MGYVKKFFILFGLFLVSQISINVFPMVKYISLGMGEAKLPMIATVLLILLTIGNIWLLIYLAKKTGFVELKLNFFTKKNVWYIVGGFVLARVIAIVGTLLLNSQGTKSTANDAVIQGIFTGENPFLIILLIGISAPIMEEIIFRAGIIGFLLEKFPIAGITISSVLFGLIHGPTDLISFVMYGAMGLIFSLAYYKTQRLEVSIAIHFLNNILPAIILAFGLI